MTAKDGFNQEGMIYGSEDQNRVFTKYDINFFLKLECTYHKSNGYEEKTKFQEIV